MTAGGYLCAIIGMVGFLFFVVALGVSPALARWARTHEGVPPHRLSPATRLALCVYAFAVRYWWIGLPVSLLTCALGALLLLATAKGAQ